MAHPQNSFRGLFAKTRIEVGTNQITGNSTHLLLNAGIKISGGAGGALTANSTTLIVAKDIKLNALINLNADSTGVIVVTGGDTAGLAGSVSTGTIQIGTNSTGNNFLAVRTTGTTWKFLNVTAALPT